jgi:insecticidal toxin complex protein TccC
MAKFKIGDKYYEAASYQEAREASMAVGPGAVGQNPVVRRASIGPQPLVTAPALVTAPPVVIAPPLAHQPSVSVSAAIPSTGEIKVVHRADGRALDHSSIKRDKGFACQNGQWCIRELACARAFVKKILNPDYDTSTISGFAFANEILTPAKSNFNLPGKNAIKQKDLNDVMVYIKRVLKDTRAFWVSTSLNKECGGYATNMDYHVYRFTLPAALKQYALILGQPLNTLRPVDSRTNDMVPTICFDGSALDGSDSTIVAINSGPVNDCEISFLTRIPLTWIEVLRAKA